jgi:hypothetical protein
MLHDPLLRARRDALLILSDSLTDSDYAIAEKAVDALLDCLEAELPEISNIIIDDSI